MYDSKAISILNDFHSYLKQNLIHFSTNDLHLPYSVGDLLEAVNIAAFTLENKNRFYIDKDVIYEQIVLELDNIPGKNELKQKLIDLLGTEYKEGNNE